MKHYRPAASGILVPLAALALWQLLSALGWVNAIILPSPLQVLAKWWAYLRPLEVFDPAQGSYLRWCFSGELIQDALGSLYRVLLGFFIGGGLALPLGLAMGYSKVAYGLFNPLVQVLRPIPPIAYIPLSILWFGLGNPPAVFLISIGAFFPVLMNTVAGVQNVDSIYLRVGRNLGASRIVCREIATSPVGAQGRYQTCVRRTADSAVARLAAPLVTARFRSTATPAQLAAR